MALSELSYNLSHQKIRQLIIEWELYEEKKCGIYFSIMTEWNGCSLDLSRIAHGLDNAAYWDWDEWTKKKIWAIFIAFANDRLMCAMNHLFYFVNCFYCCAQNVCTISVNISIYFLSLKRFLLLYKMLIVCLPVLFDKYNQFSNIYSWCPSNVCRMTNFISGIEDDGKKK